MSFRVGYEREQMLDCKECKYCTFEGSNGRPGRYYCKHAKNPNADKRISAYTIICRTERRSEEFTIQRTPKWCPNKIEEKK